MVLTNPALRYDGPMSMDSIRHCLKYNEVNGENNNDGLLANYLVNPGAEGAIDDLDATMVCE